MDQNILRFCTEAFLALAPPVERSETLDSNLAHRAQLRAKALEHLEAAHACVDEAQDGGTCYLIGCAIDELRSQDWPPRDEKVIPLAPRK